MRAVLILGNPDAQIRAQAETVAAGGEIRVLAGDRFVHAREVFISEIFHWALKEKPFVITCREGWSGSQDLMVELFSHLTGRSPEAVQYYLFDMGVEVRSRSFTRGLLSIRDLMDNVDMSQLPEQQRLRYQVLGELIR